MRELHRGLVILHPPDTAKMPLCAFLLLSIQSCDDQQTKVLHQIFSGYKTQTLKLLLCWNRHKDLQSPLHCEWPSYVKRASLLLSGITFMYGTLLQKNKYHCSLELRTGESSPNSSKCTAMFYSPKYLIFKMSCIIKEFWSLLGVSWVLNSKTQETPRSYQNPRSKFIQSQKRCMFKFVRNF